MRRLLALIALLPFALPASALAQTPDQVAEAVRDEGYFIDEGLPADPASISDDITRARNGGLRLSVVLLRDDPAGGATTFADAVLDRLGEGTVLVLSATDAGMVSTEVDDAAVAAALDRGLEASADAPAGGGDEAFVDAAVGSLLTTSGAGDDQEPSGGGGSSGLIFLIVIVAIIVLIVWLVMRRSKKETGESIEGAKAEIKAQLDAMANTILEIGDQVSASDSSEDNEYFQQASATFAEALDQYESAGDLATLAQISDRLDEARWQLDAATAIVEGNPVPPKPKKEERHVCFFDPTHPDAKETAVLDTPAGKREVRVCEADAERLRRGEKPKPRLIDVGGRSVPAPQAPRSYGGGGFDWLDAFSILAGGVGQGAAYDWGRRSGASPTMPTPTRTTTPPPQQQSKPTRSRAGRKRRRNR
jgi:hypothetical protein